MSKSIKWCVNVLFQLDKMLERRGQPLDAAVEFSIDDSLLVRRICGRWFHLASGRSYHEEFRPPKVQGVDDVSISINQAGMDKGTECNIAIRSNSRSKINSKKFTIAVGRNRTYVSQHEAGTPIGCSIMLRMNVPDEEFWRCGSQDFVSDTNTWWHFTASVPFQDYAVSWSYTEPPVVFTPIGRLSHSATTAAYEKCIWYLDIEFYFISRVSNIFIALCQNILSTHQKWNTYLNF